MAGPDKPKTIYDIHKKDRINKYVVISVWRRQEKGGAVKIENINIAIDQLNRDDLQKAINMKFGGGVYVARRYENGKYQSQDEFFNIEKPTIDVRKPNPFPAAGEGTVNLEMFYKMQEKVEEIKSNRDIEIHRLKNENVKFQSDMQLNEVRISREKLKLQILNERWQDKRKELQKGDYEKSDIITKVMSFVTDPQNGFIRDFLENIQKNFFPQNDQPVKQNKTAKKH